MPAKAEVITERFPNGAVAVERHVVQDAKGNFVNHGPWVGYSPDGKKIGGGDFVMGQRHGKWSRWFAPGEGELLASPLYREYRGPFLSEATFTAGKLDGPWVIYDHNKQVISAWSFKGGVQHGPWTWFYPSGQKRREVIYQGGTIVGNVSVWSPEGKISTPEAYINGRQKVFKVAVYAPGRKHWEGWYLNARQITKTSYDWWQGSAATVVVGVDGEDHRHGAWTWWHPNGQQFVAGAYVDGAQNGPWTWWHPNGQKWIEGAYVLGKKSGPWTWWTPEGQVEKKNDLPVIAPPAAAPGPTPGGAPATAPGTAPGKAPAGTPAPAPGTSPATAPGVKTVPSR